MSAVVNLEELKINHHHFWSGTGTSRGWISTILSELPSSAPLKKIELKCTVYNDDDDPSFVDDSSSVVSSRLKLSISETRLNLPISQLTDLSPAQLSKLEEVMITVYSTKTMDLTRKRELVDLVQKQCDSVVPELVKNGIVKIRERAPTRGSDHMFNPFNIQG